MAWRLPCLPYAAGKVRVELGPLVPEVPGFAAVVCTFMEEPFVDFSFKVARMDLMVRE